MTGERSTALFLLLMALLITVLFGFWTGLAGAALGLRGVARGTPALFGIALLLLALGNQAGLRAAVLAMAGGTALALAAAAALGPAPDPLPALREAAWLVVLAVLAWRQAPARWVLPALVLAVATSGPGAYAADLLAGSGAIGGQVAGCLVLLAAGVMLEMLALLLSGIARPARIVAALAGAAAMARLVGEWRA